MSKNNSTTKKQEQSGLPNWTKGQPKNFIQFEMEINRARSKCWALAFNNESKAYNSELRGQTEMIEQIYQMLKEMN
tara:strand:+ start:524 stop:751 length:228 start_codon:yes stop_codon:yes gene_type:complete